MPLRPYQAETLDKVNAAYLSGARSVVLVSGCGSGKSVMAAEVAKRAGEHGWKTLFLVHRKELCQQIERTFQSCGVPPECYDIYMVQTATRRLQKLPEYDLIITDEAHHSLAKSYRNIYDWFFDAVRIGLTATPTTMSRGGLGDVYEKLVQSVSTRWLIENRYLAPYKYYSVKLADVAGLHTKHGDYDPSEVAALMETDTIYGETVSQWEKLARGKKTIVYCSSVEAAERTAEEFFQAGYAANALDGTVAKKHRDEVMRRFRSGDIQILCNCALFGEGLDVPDCECVVLLRPTQSLTLHIQQSMRSMRYMPGKTAIIIDHVGNVYRHGLPDDERIWSLESKRVQENLVKIRECPNCFAVYPPELEKCPYCGFEAVKEVRTVDRKTVEVDLVEVKRQQEIKDTPLSEAILETWPEIVEFQKLHGYKWQWCLRYAVSHGIPVPPKYAKQARFYRRKK